MCDALWTKAGQGESGLGSRITVGSLSSSRLTTYREQMTHILPLNMFDKFNGTNSVTAGTENNV